MKKYKIETIVGIFVVLGLICIAYMTIKLGNVYFFSADTYQLTARFNSVTGMKVGNKVENLNQSFKASSNLHKIFRDLDVVAIYRLLGVKEL